MSQFGTFTFAGQGEVTNPEPDKDEVDEAPDQETPDEGEEGGE